MNSVKRKLQSTVKRLRAEAIDVFGERVRAAIAAYNEFSVANDHLGNHTPHVEVKAEVISTALSHLGVRQGDLLLVHASLGQFCGGTPSPQDATAVLSGLRNAIGSEGTLIMPTQSIRSAYTFAREQRIFEPDRHVSIFGTLTELFRKSSKSVRSRNPWCNLTAQGPQADEILKEHEHCSPFAAGVNSPWHRIALAGGKIAFVGVDITANTSFIMPHHILGHEYPIPVFVDKPLTFLYRQIDGSIGTTAQLLDVHDWGKDQVRTYARYLNHKYGIYRSTKVNGATITVCDAGAQLEALLNEVSIGNFYSRPDWRIISNAGASS